MRIAKLLLFQQSFTNVREREIDHHGTIYFLRSWLALGTAAALMAG